jgi:hypothetical protein
MAPSRSSALALLELNPVHHEVPGLPNYEWARRLREPSYALARTHRRRRRERVGA